MFAGFHYDLNFLTIHGRSRFPGLNIWLRNGKKMEVKVPVGCLLIQSGKQVSSGIFAGYIFNVRHSYFDERILMHIGCRGQFRFYDTVFNILFLYTSTGFPEIADVVIMKSNFSFISESFLKY